MRERSDQAQQAPLIADDEQEKGRDRETQKSGRREGEAAGRKIGDERPAVFHGEDADEKDADGGGRAHESGVAAAAGLLGMPIVRMRIAENAAQQRADVGQIVIDQQNVDDGQQQEKSLKQGIVRQRPFIGRAVRRLDEGRLLTVDGRGEDLGAGRRQPAGGHAAFDGPQRIGRAVHAERVFVRTVDRVPERRTVGRSRRLVRHRRNLPQRIGRRLVHPAKNLFSVMRMVVPFPGSESTTAMRPEW